MILIYLVCLYSDLSTHLENLSHPDPSIREASTEYLQRMPEPIIPILRLYHKSDLAPEATARLDSVINWRKKSTQTNNTVETAIIQEWNDPDDEFRFHPEKYGWLMDDPLAP